jgi:hypothetical protein
VLRNNRMSTRCACGALRTTGLRGQCGACRGGMRGVGTMTQPYLTRVPKAGRHTSARSIALLFWQVPVTALLAVCIAAVPCRGQDIVLQTATGGATISGAKPTWRTGFGNVNGLGAGTPAAGLTILTSGVTGGVVYTTPYNIVISGAGSGNRAVVMAYVSTQFAHPSTLILMSCYPSASCTSASSYTAISTSAVAPTAVINTPGALNGTQVASLGLFVSNANGAGAFSGTDSATLTFLVYAYDGSKLSLKHTYYLSLNSPSETVQTAVRLKLDTAPGGLTISPLADFTVNYGNVNGLGISPPGGTTAIIASGGMIYGTPYLMKPSFSSFSTTIATLKAYVSLDFTHPGVLELRDAASAGGPYSTISKSSGSQTILTTSASSGIDVTRYLGLFVSSANGSGTFVGSDNATLTYTLTAP